MQFETQFKTQFDLTYTSNIYNADLLYKMKMVFLKKKKIGLPFILILFRFTVFVSKSKRCSGMQ